MQKIQGKRYFPQIPEYLPGKEALQCFASQNASRQEESPGNVIDHCVGRGKKPVNRARKRLSKRGIRGQIESVKEKVVPR